MALSFFNILWTVADRRMESVWIVKPFLILLGLNTLEKRQEEHTSATHLAIRLGILQGFLDRVDRDSPLLIEEGGVPPTRPPSQAPSKALTPSVNNNDGDGGGGGSGENDRDGGLGTTAIAGIAIGVIALFKQEVMDDDNDDDRVIKRHSIWHNQEATQEEKEPSAGAAAVQAP